MDQSMVIHQGMDWELRLKQEGLGLYRGAPGKRVRFFYPEEEPSAARRKAPVRHYRVDWSRLTEREKEVILHLYYDQWSEREVARELDISRSSVRMYHRRALRKLREKGGIEKG